MAALALLLVVAGALGAALVVYRNGQRTDILVAAREIKPGQRVTSADFGVARVATDSGSVVPASQKGSYLGSYATTDIPAGTLINNLMFQVAGVIPSNGVIVGVTPAANQRPATQIAAGDVVRAYLVPKNAQGVTAASQVLVDAARVVHVQLASSDTLTVSLLVSATDAQGLVFAASQDTVALAELPNTTRPALDYRTSS